MNRRVCFRVILNLDFFHRIVNMSIRNVIEDFLFNLEIFLLHLYAINYYLL